jgi:integrase
MAGRYREKRITQSVVDAARPEAERYVLTDSAIKGFWLVVEPSGRKTFKLRYRVGGGRGSTVREPKIGDASSMKTEKARKIAGEWLADVKMGGDPSGERIAKRAAPTMAELFERYLRDHAQPHKRAASVIEDERLIKLHLSDPLGRRKVAEATRADLDRLHKSLAHTPYAANRCIALLSKAFNLAEVWGWRPDGSNPCRHVKKFAEAKRQRFLNADEVARLGETLRVAERDGFLELPPARGKRSAAERVPISRWVIAAVRLLIFTGARKGEILSLRWDQVEVGAGIAHVAPKEAATVKGKAAETKAIHLSPPAREVLASLPRAADNPHVIQGGKVGAALVNLKDPWAAIREAASLDGVRIHDLRHTFASSAAAGGASLPIIGALLGHSQPSTTARYAHLHTDPLQAATDAVGRRLAQAMGSTAAGEPHNVVPLRQGPGNRGKQS